MMTKLFSYNSGQILYLYILLLLIGPLVYIGKIPLASYYFAFIIMFFSIKKSKFLNLYFPVYFKFYIAFMFSVTVLYVFKIFNPDYLVSYRDFIIIFSPIQYMLLVIITQKILYTKNITVDILKLNIFMIPIIGIIAIFQMFNTFNFQEVLATYYGATNVEVWRAYFYWHPRASSTFNLQANTLGLYMAVSLILFHMFRKHLKISILSSVYIYIFGFIGLLLSGSVTGIMTYLILLMFYYIYYKKITINTISFALITLLIFSIVFSENIDSIIKRQKLASDNIIPSSLQSRIDNIWTTAYHDYTQNPILGIGPSALQLEYFSDNDYLDKFLRYGTVGGIGYILLILFFVFSPLRMIQKEKSSFLRRLFFFSFLIAFAFALASVTSSAFKAKRLAELYWILYSLPFINVFNRKLRQRGTMTQITILTPYFPTISNQYGGIFVYDQAIEMSNSIDKVDIFVTRPIFYISRKFPFIKFNSDNSKFSSTHKKNIKINELKYFPFPKDTAFYHKSISLSLFFYKMFFSKNILIHTLYPLGVAANEVGIKSNIVIHGTDLRYFIQNKNQKNHIVRTLKEVNTVITVSDGLKKEIEDLGINTNKVHTIENGINMKQVISIEKKDNIFKFVFVGSLIIQKGVHELLTSFIEMSKSMDNIELYFIGDGIERKKLENNSSKLLNKSIFFLGSISNSDVMEKLSSMDCLVLPSYKEGFGRVIIEMMSFGKPVISTYSGGPEYIINDTNGLLVNPKETTELEKSMSFMIKNYNKYEASNIHAYVCENYDLSKQTIKIIDLTIPKGSL